MKVLYVVYIQILSWTWFADIFSQLVISFHLCKNVSYRANYLNFDEVQFNIFFFLPRSMLLSHLSLLSSVLGPEVVGLLPMDIQLLQQYLLKKLSLLHWIAFALSKINWPFMWVYFWFLVSNGSLVSSFKNKPPLPCFIPFIWKFSYIHKSRERYNKLTVDSDSLNNFQSPLFHHNNILKKNPGQLSYTIFHVLDLFLVVSFICSSASCISCNLAMRSKKLNKIQVEHFSAYYIIGGGTLCGLSQSKQCYILLLAEEANDSSLYC